MKNSRMLLIALLVLITLAGGSAFAGSHPTVSFGVEYITDFDNSCTVWSGMWDLPYNKDIAVYFASRMNKYGNSKRFLFANKLAETTDASAVSDVRMGIAGNADIYSDHVEAYAIVTHGGRNESSNNFGMAMCTSTNWSYATREAWQEASSHSIRWGDGDMRWALLYTCHSAEQPHLEWKNALGPHFEVLMGFNGLTYASMTTDENLGDWVDAVYDDGRYFKGAWFYANEDWYYSSIDAVLMAVGNSLDSATRRRDYQSVSYGRRNGKKVPEAFAWSNKVRHERERRYSFVR